MNIASVFFKALLDDSGLGRDAAAAGDKAGVTAGEHMSKGLSGALGAGLKGGLAILAGGAAIALKGMTQLDDITAKFAADTGASADEIDAAGKAINRLAGKNLQSLSEVGDAYTAVRVQMGLTGDEQERITDLALKYATATHQDVVPAVKALDDIQDAWNLTSADTQSIMDDLIASHQKYGGEIADNQEALAKMAPQLQALNADWRDGIGLLNLFAASGLDSSKAMTALNTAVSKLKPGQTLDDLVKEISSIPDPTKRAQKAIEIFGAKGGVALANALRPGVTSLKDFEISATDAADATQKAAGRIEGSFANRIKLAIKAVGAEIIGLGQDFGPVFTGLAGIASLAGSLGLDKAIAAAVKRASASAAVAGAAATAGATIGAVMSGAFAIGEKLVEGVLEGLNAIAERAGIKAIAAKSGSIIGAVFAAAMGFAESIAEGLGDAFLKLPGIAKVRSAVLASAIEIGTLQGTAIATAASAALSGVVLSIPLLIIPNIPDIQRFLEDLNPFVSAEDKAKLHDFEDYMHKAGQSAGIHLIDGVATGAAQAAPAAGEGAGSAMSKALATGVATGWAQQQTVVSKVVSSSIGNMGANWIKVAHEQGNRAGAAVAQAIEEKRQAVDQAWQDLLDVIKNSITPTKERAKLLGELVSTTLAKALHDKRPDVVAQARATKQAIIDRLNDLKANAHNIGKDGMELLRRGMRSKDPDIRAEATAIYNAARHGKKNNGPADLVALGNHYGYQYIANIALGMESAIPLAQNAAKDVARAINKFTKISSPAEAGPWHEDGGPEGSGLRFTQSLATGIRKGIPDAVRAAGDLASSVRLPSLGASLALPGAAGFAMAGTSIGGSVSTSHVTFGDIHVHLANGSPAEAQRAAREILQTVGNDFRVSGARNGIHPARP